MSQQYLNIVVLYLLKMTWKVKIMFILLNERFYNTWIDQTIKKMSESMIWRVRWRSDLLIGGIQDQHADQVLSGALQV